MNCKNFEMAVECPRSKCSLYCKQCGHWEPHVKNEACGGSGDCPACKVLTTAERVRKYQEYV